MGLDRPKGTDVGLLEVFIMRIKAAEYFHVYRLHMVFTHWAVVNQGILKLQTFWGLFFTFCVVFCFWQKNVGAKAFFLGIISNFAAYFSFMKMMACCAPL